MGLPSKPIVWVAGNHEYYEREMYHEAKLMRTVATSHEIHFLDGDAVVIDGVRFLGCTLWTDFKLRIAMPGLPDEPEILVSDRERGMRQSGRYVADYSSIRVERSRRGGVLGQERLHPMDTLKMHRRLRRWLLEQLSKPFDGPTVVVTHHAPHRDSLAQKFATEWLSTAFVSELPLELFEVPVLWIHGHTHTSFNYRVGNCRVVCNPRGYMNWHGDFENPDFDPGLVVEIDA
jgi:Icc-related predicted phosphoesterase